MLRKITQLPLHQFRQTLPKHNYASPAPIELLIAPYKQVLQLLQQHGLDWADCLPTEERQRAEGFYLSADCWRFVAGRSLLRCRLSQKALAANQPIAAAEWQFRAAPRGKPYLCGPPPKASNPETQGSPALPHFNLAHSGAYVAIATSEQAELGLDIEAQGQRRPNIVGISQMLYSPQEQQQLQELLLRDEAAAQHLFFRLWCRYEALSKLEGTGLLSRHVEVRPYSYCESSLPADKPETEGLGTYYWALCWRDVSKSGEP